jgi:hypothetical protein
MIWRISLSKVIDFSKAKAKKHTVPEVAAEAVREDRQYEVDATEEVVQGYINQLLDELMDFDLADESAEFSRDFIFATEGLRSLIMRARGHNHFLQDVVDSLIEVQYNEETDEVYGNWLLDKEDMESQDPEEE